MAKQLEATPHHRKMSTLPTHENASPHHHRRMVWHQNLKLTKIITLDEQRQQVERLLPALGRYPITTTLPVNTFYLTNRGTCGEEYIYLYDSAFHAHVVTGIFF